jgi:N-acetylmuramoyl-L-alanine amidase
MKFLKVSFSTAFLFFTLISSTKPLAMLPPLSGDKTQKPLIYLDPGHGGLDFGAVIENPHCEEKRLCLTTSHYTKRYLEQMGYKVSLTRSRDFFVSLDKRANRANKSRAGVFVCIHYNSCPNETAHGIEVYYSDDQDKRSTCSKKLASSVLQKTAVRAEAKARGVKIGNFFVIKQTNMPAVLIEAGFLTNPTERNKIIQRQYLDKIARGIAEGIDKFVKEG